MPEEGPLRPFVRSGYEFKIRSHVQPRLLEQHFPQQHRFLLPGVLHPCVDQLRLVVVESQLDDVFTD